MQAPREHGQSDPFPSVLDDLDTLELEVVCCLACGDRRRAIARYLETSDSRVRTVIRRLTRRLGVADEAALRQLARALLPPRRLPH